MGGGQVIPLGATGERIVACRTVDILLCDSSEPIAAGSGEAHTIATQDSKYSTCTLSSCDFRPASWGLNCTGRRPTKMLVYDYVEVHWAGKVEAM
jgi:hypothetical protein